MSERLVALADDAVLIIEQRKDKVRLIETWPDGFTADTWHPTIDDAREQAAQWWSPRISEWYTVPAQIADPVTFARQRVS